MGSQNHGRLPPKHHEACVSVAIALLNQGWLCNKRDIKIAVRKYLTDNDLPSINSNSMQLIISKAKERILEEQQVTKAEGQMNSVLFYRSVIQASDVKTSDKLKAVERIDKVLGLEQHNSPVGGDADDIAKLIRDKVAQVDTMYGVVDDTTH